MEMFDVYDAFGNSLNKTAIRGSKLRDGEFHTIVHIWIINSDGKYLIQKRNKADDINPYTWAATSGSVVAGEDSLLTCLRETEEEIGIKLKASQFKFLKRYFIKHPHSSYITDLYLVKANILLKDIVLDKLEVSEVKYVSMNEIKEMIKNKQFWNYERIINRVGYFDLIEKS
ncbi:MAG: NUDIX domain-containing protein [Candidatus Izemoplasma sp.]